MHLTVLYLSTAVLFLVLDAVMLKPSCWRCSKPVPAQVAPTRPGSRSIPQHRSASSVGLAG
jgi:hypothetical protein